MSNIERFWDTIIEEAAGKGAPPDLSREILTQLDAPAARNPRRGRTLLLRAGQFATAAAALFAIAWLTGLVRFGGESAGGTGSPACEDAGDPKVYAASPGAEVFERDGYVELKRGWLLVTTGAPDVVSGDSTLADVDGRVLVHAPGRPTNEQIETATPWLNANRLETDMIKQMKAWAKGATLAALVLSGSAILDGQEIEAQDEETTEEPEWHEVSSVMDIEQLPEGVTHVDANGLSAGILDFLTRVNSIESINLRSAHAMRIEHLEKLGKLPNLAYLDLREADWATSEADKQHRVYNPLLELDSLKEVCLDPIPSGSFSSKDEESDDPFQGTVAVCKQLVERGVRIALGPLQSTDDRIALLCEELPTIRELHLLDARDNQLKTIAELPQLESIKVRARALSWVTDVGLAYLAEQPSLTRLDLEIADLEQPTWYQIGKMKQLRELRLVGVVYGNVETCFEQLSPLQSLESLDIAELYSVEGTRGRYSFSNFSADVLTKLPAVHTITVKQGSLRLFWESVPTVPAKRLVVADERQHWGTLLSGKDVKNGSDSVLETLVIHERQFVGIDDERALAKLADVLAACPKLKTVEVIEASDPRTAENEREILLNQLESAAPDAVIKVVSQDN